jgi:hypothetical protein
MAENVPQEESKADDERIHKREPRRRPDYKSDGVSVWINTRENGRKFLSIKMVGHSVVFANEN